MHRVAVKLLTLPAFVTFFLVSLPDIIKEDTKERESDGIKSKNDLENGFHEQSEVNLIENFRRFSRERLRERYYIMFVWELSQQRISGYDLAFTFGDKGRFCIVQTVDNKLPYIEKLQLSNSLKIKGAKLFNLLPKELRNFNGDIQVFGDNLDMFLSSFPDKPSCPHRTCMDQRNSLLVLMRYANQ